MGPFIADFVCLSHHLIIEVDRSGHATEDQAEYDAARSDYLQTRNMRVIRFRNEEILSELSGVIAHIKEALSEQCRSLSPPGGERVGDRG